MGDQIKASDNYRIGSVLLEEPSKAGTDIDHKGHFESRTELIDWLLKWTLEERQAQPGDKEE